MDDSTRDVPVKLKGRSAVSNGSTLLIGVDDRSRSARRFRDLYHGYLEQTGGEHDELCRQAATLVLQRERLDAAVVRGEPVDPSHLVRLAGSINRTLAKLGFVAGEPQAERNQREQEDRDAGLVP